MRSLRAAPGAQVARRLLQRWRGSGLKWRYLDNLLPGLALRARPAALAGESARVLGRLRADGVAISHVERLGLSSPFAELAAAARELEAARAGELARARSQAGEDPSSPEAPLHKTFVCELLGRDAVHPLESPFVCFALAPPLLELANAYFGMLTRLRYLNVWRTFAAAGPPRRSQLWHRDQEDRCLLKLFVYLEDVDRRGGPLVYAPRTHAYGERRRSQAEGFREPGHSNLRSRDEQLARLVPPAEWIPAAGPRGSVVFADTTGYHKGGYVEAGERLFFTCMFSSQAWRRGPLCRFVGSPPAERARRFAVRNA